MTGGPSTGRGAGKPGPGGQWLLLAPLACCGAPLLIGALAAAGALAWAGLGLAAAAVAAAAAAPVIRRRRSTCSLPGESCLPEDNETFPRGQR